MRKKIKIGLFGFGCVGKGLYDVLQQTPGLKAEIVKICCKDKNKERPISMENFTFDANTILNNPEINVIVELIDDADAAMQIVRQALKNKKAVVTANKKMVAENFNELLELQEEYKIPLLYEGAVCASIPLIRNLEEYYDNDLLKSVQAVANGTTNYILTKMFKEKINYDEALAQAMNNGYAETDPSMDIDGLDARYKLLIILAHSFGLLVKPEDITCLGISKINNFDANYADEKGYKIKLIAHSYKVENNKVFSIVMPHFVSANNELFGVDDVFNGVITESSFAEKNVFIGKGAGAYPTASAVLSDISALTYNYKYEYKKILQHHSYEKTDNVNLDIYLRTNEFKEIEYGFFNTIYEKYNSNDGSYIIGNINLKHLKIAGWLNNSDYSIIVNCKRI